MAKNRISYLMSMPYMLLFCVFTLVPVCASIALSFTYYNLLESPRFVFMENYRRLFLQDDIFLTAGMNTFVFAAITGPVSYIACFVLAWAINDFHPKVRAFLTVVFYAPSISGAVYIIWQLIFSSDAYGIMNTLLMQLGITYDPILWLEDPRYVLSCVIVVAIWCSLGTSFLTFIAGLQGLDRSLFEAAAVDGMKNRFQELWYITLPSMRPQLMFGAVMQITAAFGVGDISANLAGNPSVDYSAHTVVNHITDYGNVRYEMGYACAIAVILLVVMVGTNKAVQNLLRKVGD